MLQTEPVPIKPAEPSAREQFARAPLAPIAVAISVGVLADRYAELAVGLELLVAAIGLVAWFTLHRRDCTAGLIGLFVCWCGLAAAYHHRARHFTASDDIGQYATDPPGLVRFRGVLVEEPTVRRTDRDDPFIPVWKVDHGSTVVSITQLLTPNGWVPSSGRVHLTVDRAIDPKQPFALDELRIGDEIEATGFLHTARGPSNPGEHDFADAAKDRQISADVRITKSSDTIVRLERSQTPSLAGTLAAVRGRASRIIDTVLPEREAGLGRALLLGDGTAMERSEWDSFVRTGVVHVLAISGQHLVVLAGFFWVLFRVIGVPRRTGAWVVIILVVSYAAVTGMRPSAFRATVMVAVACLGLVRRKPLNLANAFALAWIAVVVLDPVDLVNSGNLLSFLSVFTLIWGAARWLAPKEKSAQEKLFDEFRPAWIKAVRHIARILFMAYAVNAILFVANSPLIVARQNIISPVGLLVGPPLVFLTEIALIAGFAMLLVGSLHPLLAAPFGWLTEWSLSGCGRVVTFADRIPGGSVYLPSPPMWWLVGFYVIGTVLIFATNSKWRIRLFVGLFIWLILPIIIPYFTSPTDELRVTFVAVGHGGCTVLEFPDGRVMVYDVGTLAGPDAVRRSIAPFLWHRGIRKIDELFLSHADSDHFNGVPELLRRFPVGRVVMTPSFASKPTHEVAATLAAIRKAGVEPTIAVSGDRFTAGTVTVDVLHPPPVGPTGIENERSLVLLVTHAGHSLLLTGDLEKQGTARVIGLPPPSVDVLMAPHHGSRTAFTSPFVAWARPTFVVVNRGFRASGAIGPNDAGPNATVWDTVTFGAVIIRSHRTGLTAEAFRTNDRMVLRRGGK